MNNDMMKYGKANGLKLVQKYIPKLNPFKSTRIVSSIEEWEKIKNECPQRITCRTDTKIGEKRNVRIEGTSGKKEDIPDILKQIKNQNPDAVLLLLEPKHDTIPRYENDGGFNIIFDLDKNVIIEIVGKGFDAREITREKAVHERYNIPWNEILFIKDKEDLMKNKLVEKYFISQDEYTKTREERIKFLSSIEQNIDIEEKVPKEYNKLDDELIKDMLDDIILPMYEKKRQMYEDGLKVCNVQGNIVNKTLEAWEIFKKERLISNDIER